ncbi:hypothetical protein [Agromyces humi]|uniref:hypothetical protein n=1 Tax=Agromyces humi TaxID=1766800 RepID=UPI001357BB32|nr:hypothetical protein [Agromyces humi]
MFIVLAVQSDRLTFDKLEAALPKDIRNFAAKASWEAGRGENGGPREVRILGNAVPVVVEKIEAAAAAISKRPDVDRVVVRAARPKEDDWSSVKEWGAGEALAA